MARTVFLFALAAALVGGAWARVERGVTPGGEILPLVALALVPALAVALGGRRISAALAFVAASLGAAAVAFRVSPARALPGADDEFLAPILAAARDGFREFYEVRIPFDPVAHWQMHGLVLLAIFGFLAVIGALVAARRPLAAALALLVGVGWPATMAAAWVPGSRPLLTGALTLAALLAFLFLLRGERRPLRPASQAAALGALLVIVGVGASSTDAVAKPAFLDWTTWDFYDRPDPPVSVRYVWDSNYSGVRFPEKETVVLEVTVSGPRRALYWRATTLDAYTGLDWRELLTDLEQPVERDDIDVAPEDALLPADAGNEDRWVEQVVEVEALRDNHLVGSAQPVRWETGTGDPVQYAPSGVVLLPEGLQRGQRYKVWSYVPNPRPVELARAPTEYPAEVGRYLEINGEQLPSFATRGRDALVRYLFEERPWAVFPEWHRPLYQVAKRVAGDAESPYEAAVQLEAWLRSEGEFVYDEQPPHYGRQHPLTFFVLESRRGYCQQFAGTMALMLRLLGVPARVGAGFTSGDYDPDERRWTVTDHNAHTWVEVYFPGHGWLPFDPTPGRGRLAAAYSTASPAFDVSAVDAGLIGADTFERIQAGLRNTGGGLEEGAGVAGQPGDVGGEEETGPGLVALALLLVAAGALALVVLKALRRAARFAVRDPRAVAAACRRDLVGFLADQGIEPAPSATAAELAQAIERAFVANAGPFVEAVTAARFGPPDGAARAARRARRELRLLRRSLRRQLGSGARLRGALSLRSLLV